MNNHDPFVAWLDAEAFTSVGVLRSMRPGDRFTPLGMVDHSVKMTDFFINVKLPQRARKAWPLVCASDQIVWVPGYQIGHAFRITSDTTQILKLHLKKKIAQGQQGN
jgi:tRNA(Ile)-lysidine synthase